MKILDLSLLTATTYAWSQPAHLLTARIAMETLYEKDPTIIGKIDTILAVMKGACDSSHDAEQITEDQHPMVECASYADTIKWHGGGFQSTWHYKDHAYLDQGGSISDFPEYQDAKYNLADAVKGMRDWFNKADGYDTNYYIGEVRKYHLCNKTEANALSTALRFIIHFAGDAHCALHNVARVNKDYPAGDKGGNAFVVKTHYKAKELHAVWDKMVYEFPKTIHIPFDSSDWTTQGLVAKRIMLDHPESSIDQVDNIDPDYWHQESYQSAIDSVYPNIGTSGKENVLPADYVKKGVVEAEKRVAIGGYRLAYFLQSLNLDDAAALASAEMIKQNSFLQ